MEIARFRLDFCCALHERCRKCAVLARMEKKPNNDNECSVFVFLGQLWIGVEIPPADVFAPARKSIEFFLVLFYVVGAMLM